ncbi:hypothetical protein [Neobacillus sp. PS3-40]|uniref:hypothetical protein n=1 Tax=Neobacillus sp. PS3-40 TaxID=3070679 RepID=UPI0027E0EC2C|nr:hypothetical protein [Neobacillus sp. PS3-40]WML45399.1 hypothetical protein RCG20_05715 [Neobacillus sp. PS3-40]
MKNWLLLEVCKGDPDCDKKIRELILVDKKLVKNLNELFVKNTMYEIKKLITNYIKENKIIIRTCKECGKKNVISSDNLIEAKCVDCNKQLVIRQDNKKIDSFNKEHQNNNKGKKCIYCGAPVAPYSNMVCQNCYRTNSLSSIRFN